MTLKHFLYLKILASYGQGIIVEAQHVYLLACFVYSIIKDDLKGLKNFLIGEVPVCVHHV